MAQPLQYQSQFVPTDFNTVGNILGMFRQDMSQRNQEFDQGAAMEAQTLADLGALSAHDEEGKQQRIGTIEKLMKEAVAKRGGDYGAASRDIATIIAKERANPWYQFNKEQQEAIKNYDQLKLNADNVVIGDPRVKFQDYQKAKAEGKNPFLVSGLSKNNLYNQVSKIASNFADKLLTNPKISNSLGGQYFQIMQSKGVSPETFEAFINTGEGANIMQSVLAANPELQGANIDTVKEVVKQGLYSAMGPDSSQYVANKGYVDPYDRYRIAADKQVTNSGLTTSYEMPAEVNSKIDNKVRKEVESISKLFGTDRNIVEPSKKTIQITSVPGMTGGGQYSTEMSNESSKAWDTFNEYKNEYDAIYKAVKKAGGSDEDFVEAASQLKRNQAYILEDNERLNNASFSTDILGMSSNWKEMFKEGSYDKFNKEFKDAGGKPDDVSIFITPRGEVQLTDPKGKKWTVNKDNMSKVFRQATGIMETTFNDFFNYKISEKQLNEINNKDNFITANKSIRVFVNPDNPLDRRIDTYMRGQDGEMVKVGETDLKGLQRYMIGIMDTDATNSRRNPKADTN